MALWLSSRLATEIIPINSCPSAKVSEGFHDQRAFVEKLGLRGINSESYPMGFCGLVKFIIRSFPHYCGLGVLVIVICIAFAVCAWVVKSNLLCCGFVNPAG